MNRRVERTKELIPVDTIIGVNNGKYQGKLMTFNVFYGNACLPVEYTNGKFVLLPTEKYEKILKDFLESDYGQEYVVPTRTQIYKDSADTFEKIKNHEYDDRVTLFYQLQGNQNEEETVGNEETSSTEGETNETSVDNSADEANEIPANEEGVAEETESNEKTETVTEEKEEVPSGTESNETTEENTVVAENTTTEESVNEESTADTEIDAQPEEVLENVQREEVEKSEDEEILKEDLKADTVEESTDVDASKETKSVEANETETSNDTAEVQEEVTGTEGEELATQEESTDSSLPEETKKIDTAAETLKELGIEIYDPTKYDPDNFVPKDLNIEDIISTASENVAEEMELEEISETSVENPWRANANKVSRRNNSSIYTKDFETVIMEKVLNINERLNQFLDKEEERFYVPNDLIHADSEKELLEMVKAELAACNEKLDAKTKTYKTIATMNIVLCVLQIVMFIAIAFVFMSLGA